MPQVLFAMHTVYGIHNSLNCVVSCYRHPDPKQRPLSGVLLTTLQKPDNILLATSDVTTTNGDSMVLGAPLVAGHQLHLDLQHSYTTD